MKNSTIKNIGKFTFLIFIILGNICLFGYIITKNETFAASGFTVLQLGIPINLSVILILLVYGLFRKIQLKECMKASLIICINIPIAILYFYLGIYLMGF